MRSAAQILVVDDDARQRALLDDILSPDYTVLEAASGREALRLFHDCRPSLVVLDARMPEMDGWDTLRRIRDLSDAPVLMLSALSGDRQITRGLDAGADDYVAKPVSPVVLLARVRAVMRRASRAHADRPERLQFDDGALTIDLAAGRVWARGQEVSLSGIEYRLLALLAENAGRVLSARQILEQVWGPYFGAELGYVKAYVRLLRNKIEPEPHQPRYIVARRGLGYLLDPRS